MVVMNWASHRPALETAASHGASWAELLALVAGRLAENGEGGVPTRDAIERAFRRWGWRSDGNRPVSAAGACPVPVDNPDLVGANSNRGPAPYLGAFTNMPRNRVRVHLTSPAPEPEPRMARPTPGAGPSMHAVDACGRSGPFPLAEDYGCSEFANRDEVGDKSLVFSDPHFPAEAKREINTVIAIARDQQPDNILILGDLIDGHLLSAFAHEPARMFGPEAQATLQDEIDSARQFIEELCRIAKRRVVWVLGNHEGSRLVRQVNSNHWMHGLRALEWKRMTEYPERLEIIDGELNLGGITFMHGDGYGSRTFGMGKHRANWVLENIADQSVVFGHSHWAELKYRTLWDNGEPKERMAMNIGYLADPKAQTYQKRPGWTHALAIIEHWNGGRNFTPALYPIIGGRVSVGGRVYGGRLCQ